MKSISTINPAITENMKRSIVKPSYQFKMWVCRLITEYHYASFPDTSNTLGNIPSKEQRKKCPC